MQEVQTHLSHVFLSGERVYKFRKAVSLGFVDFGTRARRNDDCVREVRLNRRLAPDVYHGVAPLEHGAGGWRVGPVGERIEPGRSGLEHCVVMRRLDESRSAMSLLRAGALDADAIDRAAVLVARFHADHALGTPAPFGVSAWRERCIDPLTASFESLAQAPPAVVPRAPLERVRALCESFAERQADRFERRRLEGRAVDAHGDLHLQHLFYEREGGDPIAIDCLEFDEGLRRIDAASEVAFLFMDLAYRDARALGERFLARYAAECDDYDLFGVVDWYAAYRAVVRAKVAAIAAADEEIGHEQRVDAARSVRRHLALAEALASPRPAGPLVLVGGAVGTGKSTLARALADSIPGVLLSSDALRKRRLGLAPGARASEDAYTPAAKARIYEGLRARALPVAGSGRAAVLDATWGSRSERESLRRLAAELGLEALFVEARCDPDVARARLAVRSAAGDDASDAGPELHAPSLAGFEPPDEWPAAARFAIASDRDWSGPLEQVARRARAATAAADRAPD